MQPGRKAHRVQQAARRVHKVPRVHRDPRVRMGRKGQLVPRVPPGRKAHKVLQVHRVHKV